MNPIHKGDNIKGGDIEMVVSGKSTSLQEKHFKKILGENDVLKQKLEKQRKYTEELKKSMYKNQQRLPLVHLEPQEEGQNALREGSKVEKKWARKGASSNAKHASNLQRSRIVILNLLKTKLTA